MRSLPLLFSLFILLILGCSDKQNEEYIPYIDKGPPEEFDFSKPDELPEFLKWCAKSLSDEKEKIDPAISQTLQVLMSSVNHSTLSKEACIYAFHKLEETLSILFK